MDNLNVFFSEEFKVQGGFGRVVDITKGVYCM